MNLGTPDSGNAAQTRLIAEQLIEATIVRLGVASSVKAEIPAPLKWAGAIVAALFTVGAGGMVFWLVSSVSEMQVTLARMDERMGSSSNISEARLNAHEIRINSLEVGMKEAHR